MAELKVEAKILLTLWVKVPLCLQTLGHFLYSEVNLGPVQPVAPAVSFTYKQIASFHETRGETVYLGHPH